MDADLYDEFGNYIGPDLASESEDENEYGNVGDDGEDRERSDEEIEEDKDELRDHSEQSSMAVVLHEDKRYYPSALEVYGPDVSIRCAQVSLRVCLLFNYSNFYIYIFVIYNTYIFNIDFSSSSKRNLLLEL